MLLRIVEIRQLIKPLQQQFRLIGYIIQICLGPKLIIKLFIISFHIVIVLLDDRKNFFTYPLELFYINAESVHLL